MDGNNIGEDLANNFKLLEAFKSASEVLKETPALDNETKVAELQKHAEGIRSLLAKLQPQIQPSTPSQILPNTSATCSNLQTPPGKNLTEALCSRNFQNVKLRLYFVEM